MQGSLNSTPSCCSSRLTQAARSWCGLPPPPQLPGGCARAPPASHAWRRSVPRPRASCRLRVRGGRGGGGCVAAVHRSECLPRWRASGRLRVRGRGRRGGSARSKSRLRSCCDSRRRLAAAGSPLLGMSMRAPAATSSSAQASMLERAARCRGVQPSPVSASTLAPRLINSLHIVQRRRAGGSAAGCTASTAERTCTCIVSPAAGMLPPPSLRCPPAHRGPAVVDGSVQCRPARLVAGIYNGALVQQELTHLRWHDWYL